MQLVPCTILGLSLALAQLSSAAPAPLGVLSKRTVDGLPPSDQFIACPGYRYSRPQVEEAIQRGITLTPTLEPQPGGFPHTFGNNKKLAFESACKGKTLYEFPILHGSELYAGGPPGSQGPDRVVFFIHTANPDTNPTSSGTYCGVMTHDGAPKGEFNLCPVED